MHYNLSTMRKHNLECLRKRGENNVAVEGREETDFLGGGSESAEEQESGPLYPKLIFDTAWNEAEQTRVREVCGEIQQQAVQFLGDIFKVGRRVRLFFVIGDRRRPDVDEVEWEKQMRGFLRDYQAPNENWRIIDEEVAIEFRFFKEESSSSSSSLHEANGASARLSSEYEECIVLNSSCTDDMARLGRLHRADLARALSNIQILSFPRKIEHFSFCDPFSVNPLPPGEGEVYDRGKETGWFDMMFSVSARDSCVSMDMPLHLVMGKDLQRQMQNIVLILKTKGLHEKLRRVSFKLMEGCVMAVWRVGLTDGEFQVLHWLLQTCPGIRKAIRRCGIPVRLACTRTRPDWPSHITRLSESLLCRIYRFAPAHVIPHMAVCKLFKKSLRRAEEVVVNIPHFPKTSVDWQTLSRLAGRIALRIAVFGLDAIRFPSGAREHQLSQLRALKLQRLDVENMDLLKGREGESLRDDRATVKGIDKLDLMMSAGFDLAYLTHFQLCNTNLGTRGLALLSRWLRLSGGVSTLRLGRNNIGAEGVEVLSASLERLSALVELDMRSNVLGDAGARHLLRRLPVGSLRTLNLSNNSIRMLECARLSQFTSLEKLDLSENNLDPENRNACLQGLKSCCTVTHLNLSDASLSSTCAAYYFNEGSIMTALQQLNGLPLRHDEKLYAVNDCKVRLFEMELVSLILTSCARLQRLHLTGCRIDDEVAPSLAACLKQHAQLRHLDLSNNELSCVGLDDVVQSLLGCTSVGNLLLNHNRVGVDGALLLCHAVGSWPCLASLQLSGNTVTHKAAQALTRAVRQCPLFEWLDLTGQTDGADEDHSEFDVGAFFSEEGAWDAFPVPPTSSPACIFPRMTADWELLTAPREPATLPAPRAEESDAHNNGLSFSSKKPLVGGILSQQHANMKGVATEPAHLHVESDDIQCSKIAMMLAQDMKDSDTISKFRGAWVLAHFEGKQRGWKASRGWWCGTSDFVEEEEYPGFNIWSGVDGKKEYRAPLSSFSTVYILSNPADADFLNRKMPEVRNPQRAETIVREVRAGRPPAPRADVQHQFRAETAVRDKEEEGGDAEPFLKVVAREHQTVEEIAKSFPGSNPHLIVEDSRGSVKQNGHLLTVKSKLVGGTILYVRVVGGMAGMDKGVIFLSNEQVLKLKGFVLIKAHDHNSEFERIFYIDKVDPRGLIVREFRRPADIRKEIERECAPDLLPEVLAGIDDAGLKDNEFIMRNPGKADVISVDELEKVLVRCHVDLRFCEGGQPADCEYFCRFAVSSLLWEPAPGNKDRKKWRKLQNWFLGKGSDWDKPIVKMLKGFCDKHPAAAQARAANPIAAARMASMDKGEVFLSNEQELKLKSWEPATFLAPCAWEGDAHDKASKKRRFFSGGESGAKETSAGHGTDSHLIAELSEIMSVLQDDQSGLVSTSSMCESAISTVVPKPAGENSQIFRLEYLRQKAVFLAAGDVQDAGQKDPITLGRGGQATVEKGLFGGREVALKIYSARKGETKERSVEEKALTEAVLLHGITKYPDGAQHVVRCYGVNGATSGKFYEWQLVLELAPQGSLAPILYSRAEPRRWDPTSEWVRSRMGSRAGEQERAASREFEWKALRRPYIEFRQLEWLSGVAKALRFLHAHVVTHCDVKASNVLLFDDGRTPKLADFGCCVQGKGVFQGTVAYATVQNAGYTERYLAPERQENKMETPRSADVWSFGLLAFEILFAEKAWKKIDDDDKDKLKQVQRAISLTALRPAVLTVRDPCTVMPSVIAMVERCWALNPRDRPSMAEIVVNLESFMQFWPHRFQIRHLGCATDSFDLPQSAEIEELIFGTLVHKGPPVFGKPSQAELALEKSTVISNILDLPHSTEILAPTFGIQQELEVGQDVEVLWEDEWWKAFVKDKRMGPNGDVLILVSYFGGEGDEDEWLDHQGQKARVIPRSETWGLDMRTGPRGKVRSEQDGESAGGRYATRNAKFQVGDHVRAQYWNGSWYDAMVVERVGSLGDSYRLTWDDGGAKDRVKHWKDLRHYDPDAAFQVGDEVLGLCWDGFWYDAEIIDVVWNGSVSRYKLRWAGGDVTDTFKTEEELLLKAGLRSVAQERLDPDAAFQVGDEVRGLYIDRNWYDAEIVDLVEWKGGQTRYKLKWADGDMLDTFKTEAELQQKSARRSRRRQK